MTSLLFFPTLPFVILFPAFLPTASVCYLLLPAPPLFFFLLNLSAHSAFLFFISFWTLVWSRCCSTVSDQCCNTKTPIMPQAPSPCIERNLIPPGGMWQALGRPNRGTNRWVGPQIVYLQVILSQHFSSNWRSEICSVSPFNRPNSCFSFSVPNTSQQKLWQTIVVSCVRHSLITVCFVASSYEGRDFFTAEQMVYTVQSYAVPQY